MMETDDPQTWRSLKPGSVVTLSDKDTMKALLLKGSVAIKADFIVESVTKVTEASGLAEWLLFKMRDENQYLLVKIVDEEMDLRVYREPEDFGPDFAPGDRADQFKAERYWLFQQPDNPDDFRYLELRYTHDINVGCKGGEIRFTQKLQGELEGEAVDNPLKTGVEYPLLSSIVEYGTVGQSPYTELLILENGSAECDTGGLIRLYVGNPINPKEAAVLPLR